MDQGTFLNEGLLEDLRSSIKEEPVFLRLSIWVFTCRFDTVRMRLSCL